MQIVDREMSMRAFNKAFSDRASSPYWPLIKFGKFTVIGLSFALLLTAMGHHYAQAFESSARFLSLFQAETRRNQLALTRQISNF